MIGGGSFETAAPLHGSGRYSDTLRPGEFVFYRVEVGWGQSLAYRTTFLADGRSGRPGKDITTALFSPTRLRMDHALSSYIGGESDHVLPSSDSVYSTVPVRYRNRYRIGDNAEESIPGWYYLAVGLGTSADEGQDDPVAVRLDVAVNGSTEPGPRYAAPVGDAGIGPGVPPATSAAGANEERGVPSGVLLAGGGVIVLVVSGVVGGTAAVRRRQ